MAAKKEKKDGLDPMSLATWARLRSAGKAPIGGKPLGAEKMSENPNTKKSKKGK